MSGAMKKNAKDFIPYCQDQGIPQLVGTGRSGVSLQKLSGFAMPAGGEVVFADQGLSDMNITNGKYAVLVQNQSDVADEATIAEADKLANKFTITGPDTNDVLDIVIVGTLKGQLS
jgi:hypothetical protein